MKALTLLQPWASLVADGRKKIETRSWCPRASELRGGMVLAITASARIKPEDREFVAAWYGRGATLPTGCVVAVVRYGGATRTEEAKPDGLEGGYGDYSPGRWAWRLTDPIKIDPPVECKGALGIWTLPPDIEEAVMFMAAHQ